MNATLATTIEVNESNIDEVLSANRVVLLDFWASWCVPCMLMKKTVQKAAESLSDIATVGLVNIDENPGLLQRFGVAGTPTFIVTRDGQVAGRWTGMATASTIRRHVASASQVVV